MIIYIYTYMIIYIYIHIFIYIYIYIYKFCAINLNARYSLNFKHSKDDRYVFSKKIFDFLQYIYLHWDYFIKNCSKWSVKMWQKLKNGVYWNWMVAKHLRIVVIVHSSNLLNKHQWSNHLQIIWDYVSLHPPTYKYGRNGAKKKWAMFK